MIQHQSQNVGVSIRCTRAIATPLTFTEPMLSMASESELILREECRSDLKRPEHITTVSTPSLNDLSIISDHFFFFNILCLF